MVSFKRITLFCLLMVVTLSAKAFEITLAEQQINSMLAMSFPVKQSYQGFDVTFTDPKVTLISSTNNIALKTVIVAEQNGQKLRAIASAQGQVYFNKQQQVIEIIKPSLREFTVLDNSIAQSAAVLDSLKQAIGQQLPMIFLLDIKQINQLFPGLQPQNIVIRDNALVISL
ncbi:MAG: hypothetical protein NWQ54_03585 [Paraglaciecola sp.]|uniref:hypothetical protein n=1 Tax=Pseudomonadati TaxID=3379134 RepID=UPI00273D2E71|nr:hypothetical protein [Paraglaciecola sp.]MDP5029869.1 hypothetical protein [Paraglaciecola sp.]MDP5129939.1 hypothetical protein [Paraglaciecola sp.]